MSRLPAGALQEGDRGARRARDWRKGLADWVPGLKVLREYQPAWLRNDITAGIVLSTMLVPVGIAYAVASGVPAIYGLYATIVPLLVYALFGPSRILVLGPDSSLAPVILGVVLPLSVGDPDASDRHGQRDGHRFRGRVHPGRAFPPGLRHRAALQADPLRLYERHRPGGADQPACPSCSASRSKARARCATCGRSAGAACQDKANWMAAALGIGTFAVIMLLKGYSAWAHPDRCHRRDGDCRLVRAVGTHGVKVLGPCPGPARLAIPWIRRATWSPSWSAAVAVAIVAFADTSVLSRTYAARTNIAGRPQPGDGRPWRGQPGGRFFQGSRSAAALRVRRSPRPRAPRRR